MTAASGNSVHEALDNDVVLKAVRYGAVDRFWPVGTRVGVLGAAKFVIRGRIKRLKLQDSRPTTNELDAFIRRAVVLEPSEDEVVRAAEVEREAQQRLLPVDPGESQLAAMVVERAIALMSTGDKRAIASFEQLLEAVPWLVELCGRVRCLEQLVLELARDESSFEGLAECVCSDRDADKTMTVCFSCHSGGHADANAVEQGLLSYIGALRREAPRLLAPDS